MMNTEERLVMRSIPAGAGALRFAAYWLLGALAIGTVFGLLLEAAPPPSPIRTPLVLFQAVAVVAWLVFVVHRGTRGGRVELSGRELTLRPFLARRRFLLTGERRLLRFVTHSQGRTYVVGPALQLRVEDGSEVSVACTDPSIHVRLGLTLGDGELIAPSAVVAPADFEALLRRVGE